MGAQRARRILNLVQLGRIQGHLASTGSCDPQTGLGPDAETLGKCMKDFHPGKLGSELCFDDLPGIKTGKRQVIQEG